jgi:phospholipase D1/2
MAILNHARQGLGPHDCSESGVLVDARDYYRAFYNAAKNARSYIALAGWQFDADVRLLRGEDAPGDEDVRLLPFLHRLCEQNPELRVYMLAWDFSALFGLDREWMDWWAWDWWQNPRVQFRFDTSHASAGRHHQKLVLIDGDVAFLGGMDLCANRWDDRTHNAWDSRRDEGLLQTHGPYHNVQAYVHGGAAAPLVDQFRQRWTASGGGPLELRPAPATFSTPPNGLALPTSKVWFSRTQGRTMRPPQEPLEEIRHVYVEAIKDAEKLIYLETPNFSSKVVFDALLKRMQRPGTKPLDIVFLLPKDADGLEDVSASATPQARMLRELFQTAKRCGHRFAVFASVVRGPEGEEIPTYLHSKLLIVDDRFLTLGSASATNRSMALDTELNISWESGAPVGFTALRRAIRSLRMSLLAEHSGISEEEAAQTLKRRTGLVTALETLVATGTSRLKSHVLDPLSSQLEGGPRTAAEDAAHEPLSSSTEGLFVRGLTKLYERIQPQPPA